jgi:NarL family two-component system sensor histidine kinase LiaS
LGFKIKYKKFHSMVNKSPFPLYNNYMDRPSPYIKRFRQLRWKLTLSYTGVTVGALLTVELILLASAAIVLAVLLNSGVLQAELINAVSEDYTPQLQFLLSQTPPDQDEITSWLGRMGATVDPTIPLTFNASDQLFIIGHDGVLLGSRPPDIFGSGTIGRPVNMQALPGLAAPLQAALGGEEEVDNLYTLPGPDESVIMAIPIWNETHDRVLGVLVAVGELPTVQSVFSSIIPIIGISFLVLTLIAGIAGTIYGSVAARGLTTRLDRLSEGTHAWSQGDFTQLVEDASRDEIGQLAYNLNQMAGQLQQLMETRRELVVIEERNRLARDLHDSVKQQAFAASAQISTAKRLLSHDPEKAMGHIEEAEGLTDGLRQELTSLIQELRPPELEGKGLAAAVRDYSEDWSRQNGIELDLRLKGERVLALEVEQAIFRIVQEALANVARHSNANKVEISLEYSDDALFCTIRDNGRGFDPNETPMGFGIRSMQERAKRLGSQLQLESKAGKGATIKLTVTSKRDSPKM